MGFGSVEGRGKRWVFWYTGVRREGVHWMKMLCFGVWAARVCMRGWVASAIRYFGG